MLTGIWHSNQMEKVQARQAYYQRDLIQWATSEIQRQEAELEAIYDLLGVKPDVFYYEDMVQDLPGTLASIFRLAEEPLPDSAIPDVNLKRLSNPQSKAWLERFRKEEENAQQGGQAMFSNPEEPVFEINLEKQEESLLPGTKLETRFHVQNLRKEAITFIGYKSGNGSIRFRVFATRPDGTCAAWYRLPVPYRLEPGEKASVDFNLEIPAETGSYTLDIQVDQMGVGPLKVLGNPEAAIEVSNHLEAPLRSIFGEIEFTADNWYYSPWFGYFYAHCWPMLRSLSHGWLKVEKADAENKLRVFDFKLGFWTTSAEMYPEMRNDKGELYRYVRTEGETRMFEDVSGNPFQMPLSKNEEDHRFTQ
jgi:hypothetical protein